MNRKKNRKDNRKEKKALFNFIFLDFSKQILNQQNNSSKPIPQITNNKDKINDINNTNKNNLINNDISKIDLPSKLNFSQDLSITSIKKRKKKITHKGKIRNGGGWKKKETRRKEEELVRMWWEKEIKKRKERKRKGREKGGFFSFSFFFFSFFTSL